jgi:hypothetical protein
MPHPHAHAGSGAEGAPSEGSHAPGEAAKPSVDWECHLCGLIHRGERPPLCAACKTGHLLPLTPEQAANAKPAAFLAVEWDEAAKQRLERVPPGFMRDMTRSRVEKWARAAGRGRVDLETMDGKYGNWGAGGAKVELTLAWDAEAQARAERIPDFIRPMVQKEIERVVKGQGRTVVAGGDIDLAMAKWSAGGHFHGHGG